MADPTPAPWVVDEYNICAATRGNLHVIGTAHHPIVGDIEANLHMMAASRELYEALVDAKTELEDYHAEQCYGELYNNKKLNAALAKARGETPSTLNLKGDERG